MPHKFDFTYISWGAGTQSTALAIMSALGIYNVPKADVAIFSDTGDEPASVYKVLDDYREILEGHGLPVQVISEGRLSDHITKRGSSKFTAIPAFTSGEDGKPTVLRRQCTREYKITPIEKQVRKLLGFQPGQRIAGKKTVRAMIGITTDEIVRMKPSRTKWVENHYPLIDADLSRDDCISFLKERNLPPVGKSSCVFCPFHSDAFWEDMKHNEPEEFEKAALIDDQIRDMSMSGPDRPVFLHRSLTPLREVRFQDWKNPGQLNLFDGMNQECEGMCGV